jgi:hypothetical protein
LTDDALRDLADRLDVLESRHEIHDALMRCCRGVDRGDPELIRSAFHDGAWIRYGPRRFRDAAEFADLTVPRLDSRTSPAQRHTTNHLIKLDGDTAAVESYFVAFNPFRRDDGREVLTFVGGRYLDRFERRDGRWAISERTVVVDWSRADLPGEAQAELSEYLTPGRRESDPSHALFSGVPPSELG